MSVQRTISSLIIALLMLCSMAASSQAGQVGFRWLSSTEPNCIGYKIYYGTTSRNYTFVIDVGLPEVVDGRVGSKVDSLQEGQTYFFAATAYSDSDESDYSTEVEHTVPITTRCAPPIAHDLVFHGNEDTTLSNQLDVDNLDSAPLLFTVIAQPEHGTLIVEDATGSFIYTPIADFYGTDGFNYTATNSAGVSDEAKVTLCIFGVDEDNSLSDLPSSTDTDGDGLTNLLDANSDNDGTNDGVEINAGFNPAILHLLLRKRS